MQFTDYVIPHDEGHEGDVPDYYPLTGREICTLLEAARTAKKWGGLSVDQMQQIANIQCRLIQGIPGMTCPSPMEGDVSMRHAELNRVYVNWIQDPMTLVLKDQDIHPTDEIVIRLCGLMDIKEA